MNCVELNLPIDGQEYRCFGRLEQGSWLEPHDAFILSKCVALKRTMGKYLNALEDFNKAYEFKPNDAFTLKIHGATKKMVGKYLNALEDLNRVHELKSHGAFILEKRGAIMRRVVGQLFRCIWGFEYDWWT